MRERRDLHQVLILVLLHIMLRIETMAELSSQPLECDNLRIRIEVLFSEGDRQRAFITPAARRAVFDTQGEKRHDPG